MDELKHFFVLFAVMGVALLIILYGFPTSSTYAWIVANRSALLEYGSIPVVSIFFTYGHIAAAVWLMFYPIEFVGCCKNADGIGLGWQGIVPRKSVRMATTAVRLMTEKLLKMSDVFGRLDPIRVSATLLPAMSGLLTEIFEDVGSRQAPKVWSTLGASVKASMVKKAADEAPQCVQAMMAEVQARIEDVFDVKAMVLKALTTDKELLNEIFLRCGKTEFRLIKVSGAWIGFLFGLIQMGIWLFYKAWWILPVTGFLVGFLTNWIALKLIFEPIEPVPVCCGLYELQGLFLKRQKEVSRDYAALISQRVLTARNLLNAMLSGPLSDKLVNIVSRHVRGACDAYAGPGRALILLTVGSTDYESVKRDVVTRLLQRMPDMLRRLESYTDEALDMENLLRDKMAALPSRDFENMLHPVFQEDEIILIVMGAVLGVLIGFLQTFGLQ
jgi:uncharacterized membrane protein YheB (UPF0754 family)